MTLRKSFFLMAVLILLLAACQPVSVEEANAQLCAELDEYQAALDGVGALTAESTVEEAEAALELVANEWDDVANAAYNARDAAYENLDEAYEDLDDALREIGDAATIADAQAMIQEELANVNAAYDEFNNLHCPE
jgi:hypothetical protein